MDRPRWGPRGPGHPQVFFFFFSYYIFNFCSRVPLPKPYALFSSISLVSLTQIAIIQLKNNKNIHNGDCILATKKKKKLFYYERTKKSCVIGEVKSKLFATTVNWYKYQLTVASY